ncbi:hypothetical protein [Embleya sp. AB8]|uniref:hypothetical protein n=1 Tax=Embleya sp. AB8 TaxID=3156304 RepID=UPI003C73FC06
MPPNATPKTYPTDPIDWTKADVTRFWADHANKQVRDRLSGRVGKFVDVIGSQGYVKLTNGLEFQTRCGFLEVLDDEADFATHTK